MNISKIFRHVSNRCLEGLKSDHNIRLNLDSLIVVMLMPDLLHLIKLIDMLVEVGARKFRWPRQIIVLQLMVWMLEVFIVGHLVGYRLWMLSEVSHTKLKRFLCYIHYFWFFYLSFG